MGVATNETEAKEHLAILHPDLVLLDVYFPDMDGFELLQYIHQYHDNTDVIMITAAKEVRAVKSAVRSGVFDYIVKPVMFDRFQETLLRYRAFRKRLDALMKENPKVDQQAIDELMQSIEPKSLDGADRANFPKGIDKLTLEKVQSVLDQHQAGLTAEQMSQKIGCSRTTARRYLEYLVAQDQVQADLSYGVVGRPERIYRPVQRT